MWSYPRGPMLDKAGETAVDICAYAAHMAALLGAHIIKVKPPTDHLSLASAKKAYDDAKVDISTMAKRVENVVQSCFNGRRIVIFSGGENAATETLLEVFRGVQQGGANGAIIGRNTFQRPRADALSLLASIIDIFKGQA